MLTNDLFGKVRRGIRKPPKVILKRLGFEISEYAERYLAPKRARRLTLDSLLKKTDHQNLYQLWNYLSKRPYFSITNQTDALLFETYCPGEANLIFARAKLAMEHRVDLLGSGLIDLGRSINWHKDYKSQYDWPMDYMRDINYNNPERPSDVKFPWEVSRLQWLIPVGQAYLLSQDERYAELVKDILLDWIKHNPYACGINWACTMEVALRILTWTWFFHVFKAIQVWQNQVFQEQFLTMLYLHADFTERHLEYSDINGNHYTADAAGLVFAGLFFGESDAPLRWQDKGWVILRDELPKQVFSDGVDFEASVPYHRLVLELFFLPACYRKAQNLHVPIEYNDSLCRMAQFSASYAQPGGTVPLWGDADDARALPFGNQHINDHRYLPAYIGYLLENKSLMTPPAGSFGEHFWMYGASAVSQIQQEQKDTQITSCMFPQGGFYIMRNSHDHVFIVCGPLGLGGRGGHGHNDCLSFEAVLDEVKLISDCGAYVYTASYKERNLFRSTDYHNTPCIDDEEINRFIRWDYLWTLHNDAKPIVEVWQPGFDFDYFCGVHTGYQRLPDPVTPRREITLNHREHSLTIQDEILCNGRHKVSIPLHLAPNIEASISDRDINTITLQAGQKRFTLCWEGSSKWMVEIVKARISPSYGVVVPIQKLLWQANINQSSKLIIFIKSTL